MTRMNGLLLSLQTQVLSASGQPCYTLYCSLFPMIRGYLLQLLMRAPDTVGLSLHFFLCLYLMVSLLS